MNRLRVALPGTAAHRTVLCATALRRTALLSAGVALVAAPVLGANAVSARPHSAPGQLTAASGSAAASALPPGRSWTATLVTGDVVGVRTTPTGPPQVTVRPGPGRQGVIFSTYISTNGHIEVLPHDVAPLLGKVLDPTLFNVTTLIQDGDDNAHRSYLPLVVRGESGRSAAAAATAMLPALRRTATLSGFGAVAVREPKTSAAQEGRTLAAMASASLHAGGATPQITGGVSYIWLDRTVRTVGVAAASRAAGQAGQLDHNLVQIGAETAWQDGDTGAGVTVAVLDTGVDATHPDLTGQVIAVQNFSDSPDAVDHFGHGTFVAAQIAGTGAAADGERRGIAFGAKLLIGKVLDDPSSPSAQAAPRYSTCPTGTTG